MEVDKNNILFNGFGSGHGLGVSLESALEMSKAGYQHSKILSYFYKNIHVVNLTALSTYSVMKTTIERDRPQINFKTGSAKL
jgi:peptidoglycan hydrolase-like amidase